MLNYPTIKKKIVKDSFVTINSLQLTHVKESTRNATTTTDSDVISELVRRIDDQLSTKTPGETPINLPQPQKSSKNTKNQLNIKNKELRDVKKISPPKGFLTENVTNDKYVFFRCVSKRLFDDQNSYLSILTKAIAHIRKNQQIFNPLIANIPDYLKRVSENKFDDFILISSALSYKFNLYFYNPAISKFQTIYYSDKFKITIYLLLDENTFYLLKISGDVKIDLDDCVPMKYTINLQNKCKSKSTTNVDSNANSGCEVETPKTENVQKPITVKNKKNNHLISGISKSQPGSNDSRAHFQPKRYKKTGNKGKSSKSEHKTNNLKEEPLIISIPKTSFQPWSKMPTVGSPLVKQSSTETSEAEKSKNLEEVQSSPCLPDSNKNLQDSQKLDDGYFDTYSDYQSDMTNSRIGKPSYYYYNYDSYCPMNNQYYSDSGDGLIQSNYQDFMYSSFPNGYYNSEFLIYPPYAYNYYINNYDLNSMQYNAINFRDFNKQKQRQVDKN